MMINSIHDCQTVGVRASDSSRGTCSENRIFNCLESGAVATGQSEISFINNVSHRTVCVTAPPRTDFVISSGTVRHWFLRIPPI